MNNTNKPIRLKDATLADLGQVPLGQWLCLSDRLLMLWLASLAIGAASGSGLLGLGTFCALRYIGQRIDQAVESRERYDA
ncbi:hypothetical protein BKK79_36520 (plasmid) [Cupriavidus sp. USMAA2-4]|uniref:hypothetical protein n=1 Tax=Cupriavidus sp. USMAA2-4 TaxID=876364 RepID=UPI0008A6886D|nr:hypothetical protein [Cupriavidus sp. USMAA2-4]AOY97455.1 hypothetical protein BKK79_36520 [Cupriavidus sp. USMAA2-4]